MIIHQMKLASNPYEKIVNGQKIIESRLFDEKRKQVNIGDQIEFINNDDISQKIIIKVKALYRYALFEELFSDFSAEDFGGDTKESLLQEIHQFYSAEDEKELGVIGIKIKIE